MKTGLQFRSAYLGFIGSFVIAQAIATSALAGVIVTPSAAVLTISADNAANAQFPQFTRMSDIKLTESAANDFANTFGTTKTLVIAAPTGWVFNTEAGRITVNKGGDFASVAMLVSKGAIRINMQVKNTKHIDELVISGVEVMAVNGTKLPCLGQLHISALQKGTAVIAGLKTTRNQDGQAGTNFGMLAQVAGNAAALAFTNRPDSSVVETVFDRQPVVVTIDQFGNPTSNGLAPVQNVRLKLSAGSGSLSGTLVLNIGTEGGNGRVVFDDVMADTEGAKKLMAVSTSLSFAVSAEFVVTDNNDAEISTDAYDPDLICAAFYGTSVNLG